LTDTDFEFAIFDGWEPLVANLRDEMGQEMANYPQACLTIVQIKEKFGGLRFYYHLHKAPAELTEAVRTAPEKAENLSWVTCEVRGKPGCLRTSLDHGRYWVKRSCSCRQPDHSTFRVADVTHPPWKLTDRGQSFSQRSVSKRLSTSSHS